MVELYSEIEQVRVKTITYQQI